SEEVENSILNLAPFQCDFRIIKENGKIAYLAARAKVFSAEQEENTSLTGVCWDETQKQQLEEKIADAEGRKIAMDGITDGWWDWDLETDEVYFSPKFKEMFGYLDHEIQNKSSSWYEILHPDDIARAEENLDKHIASDAKYPYFQELRYLHKNGSIIWVICRGKAIRNPHGKFTRMIGVHTDITPLKFAQENLERLANLDQLTSIPNRAALNQQLIFELDRVKRTKHQLAVLFIDIDNFKWINDEKGHHTGDLTLIGVVNRLKKELRDSDYLARLGGDEFAIIISNVENNTQLELFSNRILQLFKKPFVIESESLYVTLSIGISTFPSCGSMPDELIQKADTAMYKAKASGKNNFAHFTDEIDIELQKQKKLEMALRFALEKDELSLVFQPQISLLDNSIWGVEALLRWHNPILGTIPPDEFIPLSEMIRMIKPIGEWVIKETLRLYHTHLRPVNPDLDIAINVSTAQLIDNDIQLLLKSEINKYKLDPKNITIEVTETQLIQNMSETTNTLKMISDMGIKIALYDFGTGYSSMNYLELLPVDLIKIDRGFISRINHDEHKKSVISGVIYLAHSLNIPVLAEGVELESQASHIKQLDCQYAQGYLYSKPLAIDGVKSLLCE
ncbi:EAL domain-containing protein, partial [Francisellaceae bacterium]|nr:EAL domain-containing protein [Francisellaceae bacterium]